MNVRSSLHTIIISSVRPRKWLLWLTLVLVAAVGATARDFPEPLSYDLRTARPANTTESERNGSILTGLGTDLAYHGYLIVDGPWDLFSLRQRSSFDVFSNSTLGVLAFYHTHLLVGPVQSGETSFSRAEWFMNAVQFEYGIVSTFRISTGVFGSIEYGRTSQHPLRGGFSEVSSDVVEASITAKLLNRQRSKLDAGLRVAYIDLYTFWESPLRKPRTAIRVEPVVDFSRTATEHGIQLVMRAWPRVIYTRQTGAWEYARLTPRVQTELDLEVGVRVERSIGFEMLLEVYATPDSEQLRDEAAPLTTLGIVLRAGRW